MKIKGKVSGLVSQENPVFDSSIGNEEKLAQLGYEQELKRSFGLVGMIGFSFSIVTCWTALGGVLTVGITSGGPPVMVWSWLAISLASLCVAYSFAEMCSAFPVAGGQYSWVAILAPPKIARGMSYITGWFMITGIVAMGATNNFIGANFIMGMVNVTYPDFVIERWHVCLVCYLFAIFFACVNLFFSRFFDKLSTGFLVWNVVSFFVVNITMLATQKEKQSARFVFADFQNETGFSSPGMAVMIGLLQSFFGMCCYDAPAHLAEEMKDPSTAAPKAIVLSVYLGAITGFLFLISAFFCIGDLETTATTSTGVPLIQIFLDSTGSRGAATWLAVMITIIVCGAANGLMAEGSRSLYAFARDHGLPFSKVFSKVNKKTGVPVNAVLLCLVIQMALNSIYFASYTGFSTVISISTFGFYLSYAMPLLARLWSRFTASGQNVRHIPGSYQLGKWGIWLNAIGLLFLTFAGISFNFPQVGPVEPDNMNYCSAAFGVIGFIGIVTWFIDGRKNFTGPQTHVMDAAHEPMMSTATKGADSGITRLGIRGAAQGSGADAKGEKIDDNDE